MSIVLATQTVPSLIDSVFATNSTVSGTVYEDMDMNGQMNGSEVGISGVVVAAYDSTGTQVGTATTATGGAYAINVAGAATSQVRVEFTTPAGYQSSFQGSGNGTSIQFATMPATSVNYGVEIPGNYCANNNVANILTVTACQRPGIAANSAADNAVADLRTIASTGWTTRNSVGSDNVTPSTITTNSQTGAVWGIASQSSTGDVWASAVLRRHAGLGPRGLGGLYVTNSTTGYVTSFDLSTYMTLSANNANYTDAARGLRSDTYMSVDAVAFSDVGKVGIGDIEFSPDGQTLYVMNLYEKKVYAFPVGGTALSPTLGTPTAITVTDPGCVNTADMRPWALKTTATALYVGVICSNETASAAQFTAAAPAKVTLRASGAYVRKYTFSSTTWSTETTVDLTVVRGVDTACDSVAFVTSIYCEPGKWHAWTSNFAAIKAAIAANKIFANIYQSPQIVYFAEPIFSGLEFLADGAIVASFADRFAMSMGWNNVSPTGSITGTNPITSNEPFYEGRSLGDTLLICKSGGTYVQESASAGGCSGHASSPYSNARLSSASPYLEFFDDNLGNSQNDHTEISSGATAVWPPSGVQQVAITAFDPGWDIYGGGVRWLNAADGAQNGANYFAQWYSASITDDQTTSFGKSSGMADIETVCNSAPVQIGNRVWIDSNNNGIQDPGESPVSGVTLHLYDSTGTTLLGTAVTNAQGEYYFTSTVSEVPAGNGDNAGGGLSVGSAFVIKLDNSADFTGTGPLARYTLTSTNSTSPATALDTSVDSNATLVSSFAVMSVPTVLPGFNDHTFDVGYVAPIPVAMGDFVWIDTNGNGTQDAGEPGLSGVTVTLYNSDGTAATTLSNGAATAVTDSTGHYLIDNLAAGTYYAVFTLPSGYTFTTQTVGSGVADSNPNTATGRTGNFTIAASATGDTVADTNLSTVALFVNPTIDAGVVVAQVTTTTIAPNATTTTVAGQTSTTVASGSSPGSSPGTSSASGLFTSTAKLIAYMKAQPHVTIGNYVWRDLNGDGLQGPADGGIAGATLRVYTMSGGSVTDVAGRVVGPQVTSSSGKYLFDYLPPGQYLVKITYPKNYYPTTPNRSNRGANSSTVAATSVVLTAGQSDLTLDFGVVHRTMKLLPATR